MDIGGVGGRLSGINFTLEPTSVLEASATTAAVRKSLKIGSHTLLPGKVPIGGVTDGDTGEVIGSNRRTVRGRLANTNSTEAGEAGSEEAKEALAGKIEGKEIYYEVGEKDGDGRTVMAIYLGTKPENLVDVNAEMIEEGHSHCFFYDEDGLELGGINVKGYDPEKKNLKEAYLGLQKNAQDTKIEIWNSELTKRGLEVARITRLNHKLSPNSQSIRLVATSQAPINLADLRIGSVEGGQDPKDAKFLPQLPNYTLEPGRTISVIVGKREDQDEEVFLDTKSDPPRVYVKSDEDFWNRDGSTAIVLTKDGKQVDAKRTKKTVTLPPGWNDYLGYKASLAQMPPPPTQGMSLALFQTLMSKKSG